MRYVTGTLAVLLVLVVVVVAFQNRTDVVIIFLFWSKSLPTVLLILGTYVLGMFTGWGLVDLLKRAWSKRVTFSGESSSK